MSEPSGTTESFTVSEVASFLRIAPRTVREHIEKGALPAFNAGAGAERAVYRILPSDLEAFIEKRRVKVAARAEEEP